AAIERHFRFPPTQARAGRAGGRARAQTSDFTRPSAALRNPPPPRALSPAHTGGAEKMAARAYWQGQIRLALVSIPVEVYSATKSGATISFHQIHEPSGKRINYEKVVRGIGPVDRDEIVKGYEVSKGN